MAGGKGTRLMPLTKNTPKSLIKINGKPFLWYLMTNLKSAGITEVFIIFRDKKEKFVKFLRENKFSANLVCQSDPLGTAHALNLLKNKMGISPFLVLAGDQLFSIQDICSVIDLKHNFCVSSFHVNDSRKYGLLVSKKDRLLKIVEKPQTKIAGDVNASLYKFSDKLFNYLSEIKISKRNEYELTDAISLMSKKENIRVYNLKDFWIDLGSKEDIPKIEKILK